MVTRRIVAGLCIAAAAASVLIALAVLLAFFSERPDPIHSSDSARLAGAIAIALFLVAIGIFALGPRWPRRNKLALATAALICAAAGAVLTWTAFDHALSQKQGGSPVVDGPTKSGWGRHPGHGGGKKKTGQRPRKGSPGNGRSGAPAPAAGSSAEGEAEAEASNAPTYPDCNCEEGGYSTEEESYGYESPPEEEWESGGEGWEEESWGEEESWEEGESWEEEGWEEGEGWEEEW